MQKNYNNTKPYSANYNQQKPSYGKQEYRNNNQGEASGNWNDRKEQKPYREQRDFKDSYQHQNGYQGQSQFGEGGRKPYQGQKPNARPNQNFNNGPQSYTGYKRQNDGQSYTNRDQQPYQNHAEYERKPFNSKPQRSLVSSSITPQEAKSQQLMVTTNNFQMQIGKMAPQAVFQYAVALKESETGRDFHNFKTDDLQKVLSKEQKKLRLLMGSQFLHSGHCIWVTQQLTNTIELGTSFMGQDAVLVIDINTETQICTGNLENVSKRDSQALNQILNIVLIEAMRETGMVQFGKRPRFFNHLDPIDIKDMNMQIWKGFKISAQLHEQGCSLLVDNCSRFMSTKNVLSRIQEIYDEYAESEDPDFIMNFQMRAREEIVNQSVIACYGSRKTYIVKDIQFENGPLQSFFQLKDGEKISVAKYFLKQYKLKVTDKRQPMLVIRQNGMDILIPSEFCMLDGVPNSIRQSSRDMRNLLNSVKQNPLQKLESCVQMVQKLLAMPKWREWDIKIQATPQKLKTRRLDVPELIHRVGDDKLYATERLLKQMPVFSSQQLSKMKLVLLHDENIQNQHIQNAIVNFEKCQGMIGIKTSSIQSVCIQMRQPPQVLREKIFNELKKYGDGKEKLENLFVFCIVSKDSEYVTCKKIFNEKAIPSQCVKKGTVIKMNLSVASNIIKQVNTKSGGESIRVKLPIFIKETPTMTIGIDVCHAGRLNSVVGIVATTNLSLTKFYSEIILQAKHQEIVETKLQNFLSKALFQFKEETGTQPEKIIVFRDGVGEGMRDQIVKTEMEQFRQCLEREFNKLSRPALTLVVVNKRISQRMFIEDRDGRMNNPEPGTIIDSQITENNDANKCFDFFLVPQLTTQGCVTPTHYFVHMNESYQDVGRQELEDLTYGMCYMYSNWSGSIRVPSVVQMAHKIAEYHNNFDREGQLKKSIKNLSNQHLALNTNMAILPYYL